MKKYVVLSLLLSVVSMAGGSSDWQEKFDLSGDFRSRFERTDYDSKEDRTRFRVRLRLSTSWKITDHWKVGSRLVTGNPDDHRSSNQTLDNGFKKFEFNLDRVYVQYKKDNVEGWFGKFGHPFMALSVYKGLIWDGDIQPEGAAVRWKGDYFQAASAIYSLDERSSDSDISAITAQIGGQQDSGHLKSAWALSYYGYDDLEGTLDRKANLIEAQASLGFGAGKATLQYIKNTDATSDEDTGFALGLAYKSKGFISEAFVQYQEIEDEAIFAYMGGDDFTYSNNFEGFVAGLKHKLLKGKADLRFVVLNAEPIIGEGGADNRYRLDMNMRF